MTTVRTKPATSRIRTLLRAHVDWLRGVPLSIEDGAIAWLVASGCSRRAFAGSAVLGAIEDGFRGDPDHIADRWIQIQLERLGRLRRALAVYESLAQNRSHRSEAIKRARQRIEARLLRGA